MNEKTLKMLGELLGDDEVSWVGICQWTGNPCFGTEDGKLLLPAGGVDGEGVRAYKMDVFKSEAINGVAFSGDCLAVSSRSEVFFGSKSPLKLNEISPLTVYNGGAHGVVASTTGGFFAPLGFDGLLHMQWSGGPATLRIGKPNDQAVDFCKVIVLDNEFKGDIVVCAVRESGLLTIKMREDLVSSPIIEHRSEGVDVVDVCSLKSAFAPRAVVALDRDGRLLWTRDVLDQNPPLAVNLDGLKGTVYSVLSTQGHVFVLTSTELVTLPNLADNFLSGLPMDRPLEAKILRMKDAVDIYLADDENIHAIDGDQLFLLPLADLVAGTIGIHGEMSSESDSAVPVVPSIIKRNWSITEGVFDELVAA